MPTASLRAFGSSSPFSLRQNRGNLPNWLTSAFIGTYVPATPHVFETKRICSVGEQNFVYSISAVTWTSCLNSGDVFDLNVAPLLLQILGNEAAMAVMGFFFTA
jgi:hypothetical protein